MTNIIVGYFGGFNRKTLRFSRSVLALHKRFCCYSVPNG